LRKILIFKHVAHEVLGTLTPILREEGFRIRYINFDRTPDAAPSLDKYGGLVVFGGWMGVYEADRYPHIKVECKMIEAALKKDIPVLGICLGAQLVAHTLGAEVRKHSEKEVGWQNVELTEAGKSDPLLGHFKASEKLFQMHGDTFEIPKGAVHLAKSDACLGQAFRYGDKAYGMQFHLEVDQAMIDRFLLGPSNRQEVEAWGGKQAIERLEVETAQHMDKSIALSRETFKRFIQLFGQKERTALKSGHGKAQ
jgi:GMP synthase (glutamine-hydrolysing)